MSPSPAFFKLGRVIWCLCPQSYSNGDSKHFHVMVQLIAQGKQVTTPEFPIDLMFAERSSSKGSQLVKILRAKTQAESSFS